jgi:uncharacterized protein (DUF697 family)/GTP-binding protein EngB required for normal cell division
MVDSSQNEYQFSDRVQHEFEQARRKIKRPNILVAGGTGAGKSTLINMVFPGEQIRAKVGAGAPVTSEVTKYPGELINVYDSPGYESGAKNQSAYQEVVLKLILDSKASAEDRIHMAWYCLSQGNHRVLDIDIDTINRIKELGVPVAAVLTQADVASEEISQELKKTVQEACPGVAIFEISQDGQLNLTVEPLLSWAADNIDSAVRVAFISGAKGAVPLKMAEGRKLVMAHIGIAATIAATPIPLSDAPLLLGNQATMIARLASLWNLPKMKSVATGGLMGQLASQVGRTLAGNLLKLIPGVGTVVGGAINAAVASSITGGIGYGVNEVCAKITRDELDGTLRDLSDYLDVDQLTSLFKSKMV